MAETTRTYRLAFNFLLICRGSANGIRGRMSFVFWGHKGIVRILPYVFRFSMCAVAKDRVLEVSCCSCAEIEFPGATALHRAVPFFQVLGCQGK